MKRYDDKGRRLKGRRPKVDDSKPVSHPHICPRCQSSAKGCVCERTYIFGYVCKKCLRPEEVKQLNEKKLVEREASKDEIMDVFPRRMEL